MTIVEFSSYEMAMEYSNLPETGQFTAWMAALSKGKPRFVNLDEIHRAES